MDRHVFPDVAKGGVTEQAMTTPMTPTQSPRTEFWTIPARSTGDASEPTFMAGNVGLFMKESKEKEIPNLDTGETWSPVTEVFQDDQKNDVPCPSSILGLDTLLYHSIFSDRSVQGRLKAQFSVCFVGTYLSTRTTLRSDVLQ